MQNELQLDDNYQLQFVNGATAADFAMVKQSQRILVLKLDALGDFILVTPFLHSLRACYSTAEITLAVATPTYALAQHCPCVNNVVAMPPPVLNDAGAAFMFGMQLAAEYGPFDLAIVPRWEQDYYNAGRIAAATDATVRLGFANAGAPGKAGYDPEADHNYTAIVVDHAHRHTVSRNAILLHALGFTTPQTAQLALWPSADDRAQVNAFMQTHGLVTKRFFALGIGASAPYKCWPAENYAALAEVLYEKYNLISVLIGGGTDDMERAAIIMAQAPHFISAVNALSLVQTAMLLEQTACFIGNDSFPMHAAAVAKCPIVEICGHPADADPTAEYHYSRFGPWGTPFSYIAPQTCAGMPAKGDLFHDSKCIETIETATVLQAIMEIMTHE